MHTQVIQSLCVLCHTSTGIAKSTDLIFTLGSSTNIETINLAQLNAYVLANSATKVLNKVKGLDSHGGGAVLSSNSVKYGLLAEYLNSLTGQLVVASQKAGILLEPAAASFRRASLLLTGKIPSKTQLTQLQNADGATLRAAFLQLMEDPAFKDFIKRGANDQLLVRSMMTNNDMADHLDYYYSVFAANYHIPDPVTNTTKPDYVYARAILNELAEAPLELIAYVVQNNKPYSEILTANYTMASTKTAALFKAEVTPAIGQYVPVVNKGQSLSGISSVPRDDWAAARPLTMAHAGVLTELGFLQQYNTTATNRNRSRSRWTYMHFLGVDIENSTARTIDAGALKDQNNPTLNNPACTVCHIKLDPIAGAFQNFGELGIYRERAYGLNSLDNAYRRTKLFKTGDVWYADMLSPGFETALTPDKENSIQQLAALLVADNRFATGTITFWWPAIFGEKMLDENVSDGQYDAKLATLNTLADNFRKNNYNFKSLLADILMSDWFRGQSVEENTAGVSEVLTYTGGKRLLTPEELSKKTTSLSTVTDNSLTAGFNLTYGGIDSVNATKRQRDLSHMMLRVAQRHALANACTIVATEFNKPKADRLLFNRVERDTQPSSAYKVTTQIPTTQATDLTWPIQVTAGADQTLSFVATQLTSLHTDTTLDTVTLNRLEIIKPNGEVLVSGEVGALYTQYDWINGTPLSGVTKPYRIRKNYTLKMEIPVDMAGTWTIKINATAAAANNILDVSLTPKLLDAAAQDNNTALIRQQIADLLERTQGLSLSADSPTVLAYTQLFIEFRQNAVRRKLGPYLTETNVRCDYNSNGLTNSVWAADPNHSLVAWRGLMMTLMADYRYIYE